MEDLVHISLGTAGATALLGYGVVFFALVLLMAVVLLMGRVMRRRAAEKPVGGIPAPEADAPILKPAELIPTAPGSAGEVKLYDTDPRTAAMLMAIVADELQAPINELRFISIREVKEDEEK